MTQLAPADSSQCLDTVGTPDGGVIGMTACPGRQPGAGHGQRDLTADLRAIRDWGAATLVTLMEPEELHRVGVADIGETAEALGLDWYHLPIPDFQAPGPAFAERWPLYGLRLRRLLRSGGRVAIHCRGGFGRTGTLAARLLVELGVAPRDAIAAVRTARPGAIETAAQESHCLNATVSAPDELFPDRVFGCLLGGAIGDAFGYTVEFDDLETIRRRFGPAGLQSPVYHNGQLVASDDTQMTLFTLEGLTRLPPGAGPAATIDSIARAYADWLRTQDGPPSGYRPHGTLAARPAMRQRRAPGNTCLSALRAGGWGTPTNPINQSKGCGAAMRVAPLGWDPGRDPAATFDLAARAGALTHGHPDGWASAGMLAVLIGALFAGKDLPTALALAKSTTATALARLGVRADLLTVVDQAETEAARLPANPTRAIAGIGQGWVGEEALAIALYAALTADSFADAVQRATNHDGDSDSTAAIAGQIWGAWRGTDALPMAWVRRLDLLPECLECVAALTHQAA